MTRRTIVWAALIVLLGGCEQRSDVKVLTLAHGLDPGHTVHRAMVFMDERLDEYSEGRMRIDIYSGGQLGSERETLELLQIGSLAMTKVSASPLEGFVPALKLFSLPYIFKDRDHHLRVLDSTSNDGFNGRFCNYRKQPSVTMGKPETGS